MPVWSRRGYSVEITPTRPLSLQLPINRSNMARSLCKNNWYNGFIDLERDCLHFDVETLYDFLEDCKATMVMQGLLRAAISSLDWVSVLILQRGLGESAFPNLRHLAIVLHETLDKTKLCYQQFEVNCSQKSTSLSVVYGASAADPTTISGRVGLDLAVQSSLSVLFQVQRL